MNNQIESQKKKKRLTQAERTAISDHRMFEAAIKLIIENGPRNTTLKDIGELAGYSRGLANYRFGSKENLYGELIKMCTRTWVADLEKFVGDKTGLSALLSALEAYEFFLSETADQSMALYTLWFEAASVQSELRQRMSKTIAAYRKDIAHWIREGIEAGDIDSDINPDMFAVQWCSFLFGTIFQWLISPETMNVNMLVADYRANVVRMLTPK
ncbi:TetR family transcriptional regulator (plasmid) [Alteromonas sp. I4]|nr:TetR family transcriptional regulator [Alteromonas sp. I4]